MKTGYRGCFQVVLSETSRIMDKDNLSKGVVYQLVGRYDYIPHITADGSERGHRNIQGCCC